MSNLFTNRGAAAGADGFNGLMGLWAIISPIVFGFGPSTGVLWSNLATGVGILLVAAMSPLRNGAIRAFLVPLAAWLFVSAFVLQFMGMAFLWNNVILAFMIMGGAAVGEGLHSCEGGA